MKIWVLLVLLFTFESLKGVHSVIWPCELASDCSVPNATCLAGNCMCPPNEVFSTDFSKCLEAKLYGEVCEKSVQCSYMPSGAKCINRKCECDEGYTYIRGRCKILKPLGANCEQVTDCSFGYDRESVVCEGKCKCAKGYYERHANLCRRISMGVNNPCIIDQDCSGKENGVKCEKDVSGKHVCVGRFKRGSLRDIAIQTSFDYFGLNTVPEGEENDYKDENIEVTAISPETDTYSAKNFGDECSNNGQQCTGLHHSLCVASQCFCKLGYYPHKNLCVAELGEEAENDKLCVVPNAKRQDGKCACKYYDYYEPSLRACKKPIFSMNSSCTSDSQCSPFGAAYCKKRCMCQPYALYDEKLNLCVENDGLGGRCDLSKTCTVQNSVCSEQKTCVCAENFVKKNDQCLPALGSKCTVTEGCGNENSECVPSKTKSVRSESICKCQGGFVETKGLCLKEASEVGDECVDSEQCKPLLGKLGKCINYNCTCEEEHHLSFGKCEEKKALGDKCSKSSECFTPEDPKMVECRNSVCHCQLGHTMDIEKQICIKPKKNSSGRPSCLKIITLLLIGSAILITSAAIKQAYF